MNRLWRSVALAAPLGALVFYVGCQAGHSRLISSALVTPVQSGAAVTAGPAWTAPAQAAEKRAPIIPIVELHGSGADLGTEHGQQLAGPIRLLHDRYLKQFITSDMQRFLALSAAAGFSSQISSAYREEIAAMARASGMDPREAMLGQCFLDLSPMTACSTVALPAEAAPDHIARFGRNLDFPSFDVADKYSTLFIVHPTGRYAFASIGWPGLIGVLTGMNEYGLSIANMEVTRTGRLPHAMPYTLLYRTILERCRTTREAIDLLQHTPRQTPNNLMIVDATGDRAVAEISPDGVTIREPDAGALVSTNHRRGADNATPGRCARYDCLRTESSREFGRIGVAEVEAMLADVSEQDETLQSMVFEPQNRVLYLSTGKDAAHRPFQRIDLAPYFVR